MSGAEARTGLQVVKLGEGARRYELDEEALRRLLLTPDVRDLPVVVVSVAGAYRGGKSFILDFFLRYLNASRTSQQTVEWLGREDEQLQGFHWRGGGERDTTGIHLWSEPIVTTMGDTGEKVAVLLMDTQGTFDSETTIGQNSTIFALSTLMSSVQIYNLSGNIKEDDLQHLQLFTEYGKLASGSDGKAFQTLMFLVRDWASDYEHAYGFQGGEGLLNLRLTSNPNQKAELREVREHIRSCFDQIKCFLMPHPGLTVTRKTFAGCIRDLTEEFRLALLQLVPSLFDSHHLTPKLVNGERIKTQDLFDYFQKYVDIFNSDELPEAVTIFKATAEACLQAAMRSAREVYGRLMEARVSDTVSVPSKTLIAWHHAARNDAVEFFQGKRKLGAQADADAHLDELIKELEARLTVYMWNNEAKVRDAISFAKKAYDKEISNVCVEHTRLCVSKQDLKDLHAEALQVALAIFDGSREISEDEEDDQRTELEQGFQQQYEHLRAINEQNNKNAVLEARELYVTHMKNNIDQGGVSSDVLQAQHRKALNEATEFFKNKRNRYTDDDDDPHMEQLVQEIDDYYEAFEKGNKKNNKIALQAAEYRYNNFMTSAWGPQTCCFHPQALKDIHEDGVEEARNLFLANRPGDGDDEYVDKLDEILENRFSELNTINVYNNERAIDHAYLVFRMKMDSYARVPSAGNFLEALAEVFVPKVKEPKWQWSRYSECKGIAIQEFKNRRRGTEYENDHYFDELQSKISKAEQ